MPSTYSLTAEQIEIQNLARDFARREILPVSNVYEKEDISKSNLVAKICQSGLVNGRIAPKFGGLGLDLFDTCLIAEELAGACSGIAAMVEASELAITVLLAGGNEEQKQTYLSMLANEAKFSGIVLPYRRHNVYEQNLIARKTGNTFVLDGFCPLVVNAGIAAWFLVCCPVIEANRQSDHSAHAKAPFAYFIVDKDTAGLKLSENLLSLGRRAADLRKVDFDQVRLPALARIDVAAKNYANILTQTSLIIASGCVGLAQASFTHAVNYARQRKTFGLPIIDHQAVAFMLAGMNMDIEATRLMIYRAVEIWRGDNGSLKLSQSAEVYAMEMAGRVTIDSVQIFGGYGYTTDYSVEKLMRDARTYQSFWGTNIELKEQLGEAVLRVGSLTVGA